MLTNHRTISTTQFALLVFFIVLAGRLFMLPLALLKTGGRYAWASLGVFLLADLLVVK